MKHAPQIIIFLIICIFISDATYGQTSWFWQNPLPQGNNLYGVQFINDNTGFAVGWNFTILKTTDSGINWLMIDTRIDSIPNGVTAGGDLKAIQFINSETGFVGKNGIFKTTDGGKVWIYHNPGITVNSIFFVSPEVGYVCGVNGSIGGLISKTTDRGISWSILPNGNQVENPTTIYFTSNDTGFVVGMFQKIAKTTDGGITWNLKTTAGAGALRDLYFLNKNTGFACGDYEKILKTTNGGENWFYLPSQNNLNNYYSICFSSKDTGYVISNYYQREGIVSKTTNSGNNWFILTDLDTYAEEIVTTNKGDNYIVCDGGHILKSTNSGINWYNQSSSFQVSNLTCVDFINESTGYIVGNNNTLVKTTNAGFNWNIQNLEFSDNYIYVKFFNENSGFIGGSKIIKTTNSGISWDSIAQFSEVKAINFFNMDSGYVASQGKIYKTFNSGLLWSYNFVNDDMIAFDYLKNNDTGFALTEYYTGIHNSTLMNDILKTTNNGSNWTIISSFGNNGIKGLEFISNSIGFLVGDKIYKSTNGGNSWFPTFYGQYSMTAGPFFYNENIGYAIRHNQIYKTTNSGNNWIYTYTTSETLSQVSLNYIQSTGTNTGYAVGSLGKILKTTNGGGIFVEINNNIENIPTGFNLCQNYPNPFNPSTVIRYSLIENRFISLKVYDNLGKEVVTLVNGKQNAGNYTVDFDGEVLPSGVYFYRLEAGEFSETKRMVLIK